MISEDRIRSMTKLAIFEEREGKDFLPLGKFYKKDYKAFQIIKGIFTATISFVLFVAAFVFLKLSNGTLSLDFEELKQLGILLLLIYVVFLVVYIILWWLKANYSYRKGMAKIKTYRKDVKKLQDLIEREEKEKKEATLTHAQVWGMDIMEEYK